MFIGSETAQDSVDLAHHFKVLFGRIALRHCFDPRLIGPVMEPFSRPNLAVLRARGAEQIQLHECASRLSEEQFGRRIFIRAVVEVSNYCRENCAYCGMRRENRDLSRYRVRTEELARLIIQERPPSVTDINLQAGEDPIAVREVVLPLLRILRKETSLGLSVCLGTLSTALCRELQDAGAGIFIIKFETASPGRYRHLQAPGTQAERLDHIRHLASRNWRVSSGFIAGLPGESTADLLANFSLAAELPLDGCSVSPFIPGESTPLAAAPAAGIDLVLNCMAALRIMRPDWVIPAVSALNLAEPKEGYRRGLRTGANLVTINLTPKGQRGDYLLYKRDRFIMTEERILSAIAAEDRVPSLTGLAAYYRQSAASRSAESEPLPLQPACA